MELNNVNFGVLLQEEVPVQPHPAADCCKVHYIVRFQGLTGSRHVIINWTVMFVWLNAEVLVSLKLSINLQETIQ